MTTELATRTEAAEIMERVLTVGDLSKLSVDDRVRYYAAVCESVGLNPLTRPFEYITLNNKLTLYARKDATDQLRKLHKVSITIPSREMIEGVYVVTARATTADGRGDEEVGAVNVGNLKGEALANAMMKATTKAKRRVTLSICGLGLLDETEVESIPESQRRPFVEPDAPVAKQPSLPATPERKELPQPPSQKQATDAAPATAEQVKHLKELLVKVTLPKGTVDKWYAAAGVKTFDQLTADQIEKCIKFCESKLVTKDNAPAPENAEQFAKEQYAEWYDHMEGVAASVECPPAIFEQGIEKCIKGAKLTGKPWESTPAQREQWENALRDKAGFFAVPDGVAA